MNLCVCILFRTISSSIICFTVGYVCLDFTVGYTVLHSNRLMRVQNVGMPVQHYQCVCYDVLNLSLEQLGRTAGQILKHNLACKQMIPIAHPLMCS